MLVILHVFTKIQRRKDNHDHLQFSNHHHNLLSIQYKKQFTSNTPNNIHLMTHQTIKLQRLCQSPSLIWCAPCGGGIESHHIHFTSICCMNWSDLSPQCWCREIRYLNRAYVVCFWHVQQTLTNLVSDFKIFINGIFFWPIMEIKHKKTTGVLLKYPYWSIKVHSSQ